MNSELQSLKKMVKSQTVLARNLLLLVFKRKALEMCSVYGKASGGKGSKEEPRAGLNKKAVSTLLCKSDN